MKPNEPECRTRPKTATWAVLVGALLLAACGSTDVNDSDGGSDGSIPACVADSDCDDGVACTEDSCADGLCINAGDDQRCDDANPCTDDSCDPASGCQHADNTLPCDDGDACTSGDACAGGSCTGTVIDCDDANPCTDDSCDPAAGCQHADNSVPCDDGDACTQGDTCGGGACLPGSAVSCNDSNLCTDDSCDPASGCQHADNSLPCDDGNVCTSGDACAGGSCTGTAIDCDDGNPCTDDGCDPAAGCQHADNTLPCDDGDACTQGDTCGGGACLPGSAVSCDDGNPCTDDGCDPASGCQHADNSLPCDDGDLCTLGDTCVAGECQPGSPKDCSDGNPCTDDGCNPVDGACTWTDNTAPCEDGDPCTSPDSCQDGVCVPGPYICGGDVNVLVYMVADNNLDPAAMEDIQEMEAANVDGAGWLRVFVLLDRAASGSWSDTRLYEIHDGARTELDGPNLGITAAGSQELNMGDPATLRHFIQDVQALAAGRYFLILWNHGDGWRGGARPAAYKAVGIDETDGNDWLYTAELPVGIGGLGIQLVGFDACLEAMTEVAYEIRGHAQVMVASQEAEPLDGWEFTGLLSGFMTGGDPSPGAFGIIAADTYMASYPTDDTVTLSVLDLSRMADLATACDGMATALTGMIRRDWNWLCNQQEYFGGWFKEPFADLYHLAETAQTRDPANAAAYDAVMAVLTDLVIYARQSTGHPDANGLSIYFECSKTPSGEYNATSIQWAADTGWDEMLQAH